RTCRLRSRITLTCLPPLPYALSTCSNRTSAMILLPLIPSRSRAFPWPDSTACQDTLSSDEARVPAPAVLDDTALRLEVDVDQPEALAIAFSPLKVIKQGPNEVPYDRRAVLYGALDLTEMVA